MGEAAAGQVRGDGEGRVDGHHLGVHGERSVCVDAASSTDLLESSELSRRLRRLIVLRFGLVLFALLQLGLHLGEGSAIEGTACDTAMLECAAIETRAVVVVALTDDLTTAHDDTAVTIVQRRLGGLLEAKREIVVRLHVAVSFGLFGGFVGEGDLGVRVGLVDWWVGLCRWQSKSAVAECESFVCLVCELSVVLFASKHLTRAMRSNSM